MVTFELNCCLSPLGFLSSLLIIKSRLMFLLGAWIAQIDWITYISCLLLYRTKYIQTVPSFLLLIFKVLWKHNWIGKDFARLFLLLQPSPSRNGPAMRRMTRDSKMLMALFDAFVKVQVLQTNICLILIVSQLFGTCCNTYLFSLYYTYICFDPKVRKVVNFPDQNGVYFLNNIIYIYI